MTQKVNHFMTLLKHQQPECYDRCRVSVSSQSNYQQYRGIDGRMRAQLNYNSPATYDIEISFPNVGSLYYDMCFYIDYVWGGKVDVIASFDFNGTNHFKFTE